MAFALYGDLGRLGYHLFGEQALLVLNFSVLFSVRVPVVEPNHVLSVW